MTEDETFSNGAHRQPTTAIGNLSEKWFLLEVNDFIFSQMCTVQSVDDDGSHAFSQIIACCHDDAKNTRA